MVFGNVYNKENILMFLRICPFFMIVKVGGGGEGGGAELYWTIEEVVLPVLSEWGQASRERTISQRRVKERPHSGPCPLIWLPLLNPRLSYPTGQPNRLRIYGKLFYCVLTLVGWRRRLPIKADSSVVTMLANGLQIHVPAWLME